jgi:hypothetical protein
MFCAIAYQQKQKKDDGELMRGKYRFTAGAERTELLRRWHAWRICWNGRLQTDYSNTRKITMHDIGYRDVESYIRSLVSEGFEKPSKNARSQSEPADEADHPTTPKKRKEPMPARKCQHAARRS